MERVWVIGGGQFGIKAAKHLSRNRTSYEVVVVDRDQASIEKAHALGCRIVCEDGVEFLGRHLSLQVEVDWIVPAVPLHLAWQWLRLRHGADLLLPYALPDRLIRSWPNVMKGENQDIYVSHADFLCPPNCCEPDHICTKTGQPRKKDLFTVLAEQNKTDIIPFVLQSHQLGPGLGGYTGQSLLDLAAKIADFHGRFFLATACRCHGVVSGGQII